LTAGDIAILVRTHREADAMRDGLRRRGLNSVSSSQQSVFASPEASNLALVLAALEDPSDAGRLRGALATDLFGESGHELYRLTTDEQAWENRLTSIVHYRQMWHEHGILPMFQSLLATESVTHRLTSRLGGQRSLTNYLHLAELLHQSPAGQHGMAALLRWFRRQIAGPDSDMENQLIRLEDDEQLLRIITVHRSKGLEFPVVILPFLWAERPSPSNGPLTFHDRDSLRLTVDLGTGREEHRRWAEEEQLAEELRLLYVAMTRAKSCCLFCWGRVRGLERTALAYLLHNASSPVDDAALAADLETLNSREPLLARRSFPAAFGTHRLANTTEVPPLQPAVFHGRINPGWTMTSYSRLSAGREAEVVTEPSEREEIAAPANEDFDSIFTFPRGPIAGTCLHVLLERLDYGRPAEEQPELVRQTLEQYGIDLRWQTALTRWLDDLLTVPLPGTCALGQIAGQDRLNELDFLFPLERLDLGRFNALLLEAGGRPLSASGGSLHGLMKGFVDLVFRCNGRYYIVDYKSNYLGPDPGHYSDQALAECMDSHQYYLQAQIYTLALHRFLGARIPGYHYDDHFGGVYYLFLRAMHPVFPPGTGIHYSRPDHRLIAALDGCCHGERT
jgi:exodeoxyribonuclease V beta subunit